MSTFALQAEPLPESGSVSMLHARFEATMKVVTASDTFGSVSTGFEPGHQVIGLLLMVALNKKTATLPSTMVVRSLGRAHSMCAVVAAQQHMHGKSTKILTSHN